MHGLSRFLFVFALIVILFVFLYFYFYFCDTKGTVIPLVKNKNKTIARYAPINKPTSHNVNLFSLGGTRAPGYSVRASRINYDGVSRGNLYKSPRAFPSENIRRISRGLSGPSAHLIRMPVFSTR